MPIAFELREQDKDGISVIISDSPPKTANVKALVPNLKSKICGIDVLTVGDIRRLGLDVIQNAEHHGYIEGLPYQNSGIAGDAEKATELAGQLALLSEKLDRQPYNPEL